MGAHSGRVFRTVLCWRRRGEWRRSLTCRQTDVSRHGWISHTQNDIVHSRARDVVRERDRIFGGLGLHPRVPPIRVRVALPASTQEAFRLADQAFSLLGARVRRALEQALGLAQQATEPAARAGALSTLVLAEATLVAHALVLTALAHTLSLIIAALALILTIATLAALILTIATLAALILTEAALTTLAALILIEATLSALVLIVAALVLTIAALILAAALGVLLVAIVGGLGCVVSLVV